MTNTKMTKKEMFAEVIALATEMGRTDIIEFAEHEIELLNKKKSGDSKKSKENRAIADTVLAVMTEHDVHGLTCTEIIHLDEALDMSTPKMSAILKMLIADGTVKREMQGKKAVFGLV